jgi:NADH dehydrogenase FAD-containing subunit
MDEPSRHLLLIGAGHAHVHFLRQWAEKPCPGWRITLVSPYAHHTHSAMMPGYVAGHYPAKDCQIDLAPLVAQAGVQWIQGQCVGLQTGKNQVEYTLVTRPDGVPSKLSYDLLSIEAGSSIDRRRLEGQMPGATSYALSLRPIEVFVDLWPKVLDLARQKPPSMVVIGSGSVAVEMVFAAEQSMRVYGVKGSRFTLITGPDEWLPGVNPVVRERVMRQLRQRHISLIHGTCTAIGDEALELGSQAALACDVPILAMDSQAPLWLQNCGLDLSPTGHALTTAQQISTNTPNVLLVGEASARQDMPDSREAANSLEARETLAHNLWATLASQSLKKHHPAKHPSMVLSCGPGHAIARWGRWTMEGGWVWWWRSRQDRAIMAAYRKAIRPPKTKPAKTTSTLAG